jgi:hypothetical protein
MNRRSILKSILALAATSLATLVSPQYAQADYPATRTTIYNLSAQRVDATHCLVRAVVYPYGAAISRVDFATLGRWGTVGTFEGRRPDGGLVYRALVFGRRGSSWQSRSWVNGKPDDTSPVWYLP